MLKTVIRQYHKALLKAKYCLQIAAASCTQKTQKPSEFDL